jgi:hypothetical protein
LSEILTGKGFEQNALKKLSTKKSENGMGHQEV